MNYKITGKKLISNSSCSNSSSIITMVYIDLN